ncbi:MAG: hypothetical protein MI757_04760 [Pirellulales bacterium]|nr:hypothetical protein [Pirellulales bacterium]
MRDSQAIVDAIRQSPAFTGLRLIGVAGSIGRGEKALSDEDLNDVDVFVVVDAFDQQALDELSATLRRLTNTEFTDVCCLKPDKLAGLGRKTRTYQYIYDTLAEHIIWYVDDAYRAQWQSTCALDLRVNTTSAAIVLNTRMWCLLAPLCWEEDHGFGLAWDDGTKTRYQFAKALSAMVDANLILDGNYQCASTADKFDLFRHSKFYGSLSDHQREILESVRHKDYRDEDILALWQDLLIMYVNCRSAGKGLNLFGQTLLYWLNAILSSSRAGVRETTRQNWERQRLLARISRYLQNGGESPNRGFEKINAIR